MDDAVKVRTCLWFEEGGFEAATFYVSLLPGSFLETPPPADPSFPPVVVEFTLAGTPYMILNGGSHYRLTPAASIAVRTVDQQETDRLWDALVADGGEESRCGWLVDRFGVSWQLVPEVLVRFLADEDREAAGRVQRAMLKMDKIEISVLEEAFEGVAQT